MLFCCRLDGFSGCFWGLGDAFGEHGVDAVAHGVDKQDVDFLDTGGARVGDVEQYVALLQHLGDFAAVASCERDDVHAVLVGGFDGFDYVAGIA